MNTKNKVKFNDLHPKIKDYFKNKNINFKTDAFEELIINDIFINNDDIAIKLNRNVTDMFRDWIISKLEKKENISINVKGATRSGKSIVTLKISDIITSFYGKDFDTEYIVCANQKEFRLKVQNAKFGDFFQIDENAMANGGEGSLTESRQLMDIQNIIAKENIHTGYITPRVFLRTNAHLGLAYWGKDTDNWMSRFLLYSLNSANPQLLGYVVINVGSLFYEYGCNLFKHFGGCTNPNKLKFKEINKNDYIFEKLNSQYEVEGIMKIDKIFINKMFCIDDKYKANPEHAIQKLSSKQLERISCPFYNVCKHPLCKYEHKKDKWIEKEMKGGLDERTSERFNTAIKILQKIGTFDEEIGRIKLKASNGKDLKIKIKLYINSLTSTKFTITETDEIIEASRSFLDLNVLIDVLNTLNLNVEDELLKIDNVRKNWDLIKDLYIKTKND